MNTLTKNPATEYSDQESMRSRILEHAAHLFVAKGYSAISMREIAEAVGISKAGLYYHFDDKENLMIAVLKEYLAEFSNIVKEARTTNPNIKFRLKFLTSKIFEQPAERRAIIRLANQEISNLSPAARATFNIQYHEEFIGQITTVMKEGIKNGEILNAQPEMLAWILLGMMYPFFYPNSSRTSGQNQEVVDTILQIFFEGICKENTA